MGLIALLMIQSLQFIGFAPDLDTNIQPGEQAVPAPWIDCDGWYPTLKGFRRVPSMVEVYDAPPPRESPADDGACYGAYVAQFLDGSRKLFVGTNTALYYGSVGSWTHYSVSQNFSTAPTARWRFAMFGNDCIAVNGTDSVQVITASGTNFAALAGNPPVAKVVATVNPGGSGAFVFLLNLSSSVPGNALTPTMWWCSGIGNDTWWTPDIATQCANGYLDDTPGDIVGARALGRNLVAYKSKATYIFEYQGPPVIWANRLTSTEAGAMSHEAIIDLGDAHAVMGFDNFYLVDSSGTPQVIENALRRFLFEDNGTGVPDLDRNLSYAVQGRYDRARDLCVWHYPSVDLGGESTVPQKCDKWVAWHRGSGKWARGTMGVLQVVYPELPGQAGITYGDFGSLFSTWGEPNDIAYNALLIVGASDVVPGVVGVDSKVYSLTGEPAAGGYFTLGDFGNGQQFLMVRRMRPRFSIYPERPGTFCQNIMRDNLGDADPIAGSAAFLMNANGYVDLRDNRRYHRFKYTFPAGDAEIMSLDVDYVLAGLR